MSFKSLREYCNAI